MRTTLRSLRRHSIVVLGCAALAAACEDQRPPAARLAPPGAGEAVPTRASELVAGPPRPAAAYEAPSATNEHALAEGERLYAWFNCNGCHGAIGGGSMGPPLRDEAWIYGSEPAQIYASIVEGRPNGMPSFRGRIPEDALWKIVAHVRSLGGLPGSSEPAQVVVDASDHPPPRGDAATAAGGGDAR